MNESLPTTAETLHHELAEETRTARQLRLTNRVMIAALAGAYAYATLILQRGDPIYLLLAAGALLAFATQFINRQRFRIPEAMMRAVTSTEPEVGLRESLAVVWPEIRARYGRRIGALGPNPGDREAASRMTLDEALGIIAHAHRTNWPRFARRWSWGLGVALGVVVSVCILHVPSGA